MPPAPIVLVHGLGGSPAEWDEVAMLLQGAGRSVVRVELPGHAARSGEDFTWGAAVRAVQDAVGTLHAGGALAPVLAGRGLGGHFAIAAAAGRPVAAVIAAGIGTETLGWFVDSYRVASAVTALLPDRGRAVSELAGRTFAGTGTGSGGGVGARGGALTSSALDEVQRFDARAALRSLPAATPFVLVNGSRDRLRLQERALLGAAAAGRLVRARGTAYAERMGDPRPLADAILEAS